MAVVPSRRRRRSPTPTPSIIFYSNPTLHSHPLCSLAGTSVLAPSPLLFNSPALPSTPSNSQHQRRRCSSKFHLSLHSDAPPPPPLPLHPPSGGGVHHGSRRSRRRGDDGLRRAQGARAPHGAAPERGGRVPRGQGRDLRGQAGEALHGQVRERAPLRGQRQRGHQLRPDRGAQGDLGAGALPLVPRQGHPRRHPELGHHLLRRRGHLQAVLALPLRDAARVPRRLGGRGGGSQSRGTRGGGGNCSCCVSENIRQTQIHPGQWNAREGQDVKNFPFDHTKTVHSVLVT